MFGGEAGGKLATFPGISSPLKSTDSPSADSSLQPIDSSTPDRASAKERAVNYSEMSKADINAEYDRLRKSDPNKAAAEGMKMHKAYFGK